MPVLGVGGSRQGVIQQTSRHEDSIGHHKTMRVSVRLQARDCRDNNWFWMTPGHIRGTAPLDIACRGDGRKDTDHLFSDSSPSSWLVGPAPRLDSADLGSDAGGVLGRGAKTRATQDVASLGGSEPLPPSLSPPPLPPPLPLDPCHEASPRLSRACTAGSAWNRDPLAHQRPGYWYCWWLVGLPNTPKLIGLHFCLRFETNMRPRSEASSSFRQSQEFLEPRGKWSPLIRASEPGQSGKKASTTPVCHWIWHATIFCFPNDGHSRQLEANDSSSLPSLTCNQTKIWKTR